MASQQVASLASCRFCSTSLTTKHRCALFSKDALEKNLPERFSRLVQLPVSRNDGLSMYCCRRCVGKLNTVEKVTEEMRSVARTSYGLPPASTASSSTSRLPSVTVLGGSPTSRTGSRKRVKDTSGEEASPHTVQARPVTKRALGAQGRRLTYSTLGKDLHVQYMPNAKTTMYWLIFL